VVCVVPLIRQTESLNQIQTNEAPLQSLSFVNYVDFSELVVKLGRRPERPEKDSAPQMTRRLWQLAEHCWTTDPKERPTADTICDDISLQLQESEASLRQQSLEHGSSHTPPRHDTHVDSDNMFATNSTPNVVSADQNGNKIYTSY
jgi:hypothetical protein